MRAGSTPLSGSSRRRETEHATSPSVRALTSFERRFTLHRAGVPWRRRRCSARSRGWNRSTHDLPATALSKRCARRCSPLASQVLVAVCQTLRMPCEAAPRQDVPAARLSSWLTVGRHCSRTATPRPRRICKHALRQLGGCDVTPDELHLLGPATLAAPVMWDETRWDVLSKRYVELARSSGTLSELPVALNSRSWMLLFGESWIRRAR